MSTVEQLSPLVWRVRANNMGPMTLTGTNSYLVGRNGEFAAIDPGEVDEPHLQALVNTAAGQAGKIVRILVTHGHPDHYPGAARLAEMTGAPVVAYREATFAHDENLDDEQVYPVAGVSFTCHFTPGHAFDHLCFYLNEEDALFTGDNILGMGTTIVAPPKGHMGQYLNSLRLLQERCAGAKVIYGGHGPAINDPAAKIKEYLDHRQMRLDKVTAALQNGAETVPEVVAQVYQDVDKRIWPAAARQVVAQFIYLEEQGKIEVVSERTATEEEDKIMNPSGVIDPVALAELGISGESEPLKIYRLI